MDLDPADPRLPSRPLVGLTILTLPVIGMIVVGVGYGIMFSRGLAGRPPSGPPTTLHFSGCPAARDIIAARLRDMGLDATSAQLDPDRFSFTTSMPDDPTVAATVPETLTAQGALRITGEGETLAENKDITDASVRMDLLMDPSLLLNLDTDAAKRIQQHVRAHPRGRLLLWLDGEHVASQGNDRPVSVGELEFLPPSPDPPTGDTRARWAQIAAWSVTVDHLLPCPVDVL